MLRRTHAAPFTRERGGEVEVAYLPGGAATVRRLDELCGRLRELEGRTRREVAEALRDERAQDARRLAGIVKALLDAADFRPPPGAERAPEVRAALFRARGRRWPPLPGDRDRPYQDAAAELGIAPAEVERLLYADAPGAHLLARAPRLDGEGLLRRYNLELARAVLLDAVRVRVTAAGGWRDLFRAVKLARLMYRVSAAPGGYAVELTGPAAAYVVRPARYGARLARVVPALARAPGWRLDAQVVRGGRALAFRLDAATAPFAADPAPEAYDSAWERALAEEFAERMGPEERRGWTLLREATPVQVGEEVFLPDFTLRHADGREALVEVVGFWTPEYLDDKLRKVQAAGLRNLVLVVYRGLAAGADWERAGAPVVWFAQKPRVGPVLDAVARLGDGSTEYAVRESGAAGSRGKAAKTPSPGPSPQGGGEHDTAKVRAEEEPRHGRRRKTRVRDFGPEGRDPAGLFPPGLDSVTHSLIVRYGAEARPRRQPGARPNPP